MEVFGEDEEQKWSYGMEGDGHAKPQSCRNSRCKAMKHNFVRWKSTKQAAEDDYGVWNLTGEVTLGFTLDEGELR